MDYTKRIATLQTNLSKNGCQALFIEDPIDILYLTGMQVSTGIIIILPEKALFILDGRYIEAGKKQSPCPVLLLKSDLFTTMDTDAEFQKVKQLGFNTETTSYQKYLDFKKKADQRGITLIPWKAPLRELRLIKDAEEIAYLKQAADLGTEGFYFLCHHLKEGMSEQEAAFELEFFWKKSGAQGLAFEPIIAFGANSSMPHYRPGKTQLKKGDAVLIDIGVVLDHYHSDMTRVVFFQEVDPIIRNIYEIVAEAQLNALKICHPGTTLGQLDDAARKWIESKGYGEYFSHGLGHGVGLEIHEFPSIKRIPEMENIPLQEGMVLTIEPGIYLPGNGGVRIEDTIVITKHGHENLSAADKKIYVLS